MNVKEFESNTAEPKDARKQVKMRFNLSDGESTVLAMLNKQVYDKLEESITNFCVVQVFSFLK